MFVFISRKQEQPQVILSPDILLRVTECELGQRQNHIHQLFFFIFVFNRILLNIYQSQANSLDYLGTHFITNSRVGKHQICSSTLEHQKDHQNIRELSLPRRQLTDNTVLKASRLKLEQRGFNQLWVKILTRNQSLFLQVVLRPSSSGSEVACWVGNSRKTLQSSASVQNWSNYAKPSSASMPLNYLLLLKRLFWEDSPQCHCQTLGFHGPVISNPTRLGDQQSC